MSAKYVEYLLGEGAKRPYKKHSGDAGWDLYCSRDVTIAAGQTADVHTDISVRMPSRMYGRITGRSSSMRKLGVLVNEGIIDNGYTGELFICVHNLNQEPIEIKKGMRIAQILFYVIEDVRWSEIDSMPESSDGRNSDGFGSTGQW